MGGDCRAYQRERGQERWEEGAARSLRTPPASTALSPSKVTLMWDDCSSSSPIGAPRRRPPPHPPNPPPPRGGSGLGVNPVWEERRGKNPAARDPARGQHSNDSRVLWVARGGEHPSGRGEVVMGGSGQITVVTVDRAPPWPRPGPRSRCRGGCCGRWWRWGRAAAGGGAPQPRRFVDALLGGGGSCG